MSYVSDLIGYVVSLKIVLGISSELLLAQEMRERRRISEIQFGEFVFPNVVPAQILRAQTLMTKDA